MGKTGKALKRRRLTEIESSTPFESSTDFLSGLISPTELAITVRTLQTLVHHTELLKSGKSDLKALRGAVFDFQRVNANVTGTGTTLTSRISSALSTSRNIDALVLLSELRLRQLSPKLGTLQRWVRDCDAASRRDGSFGDKEVLRVLDAILRCTNGVETDEAEVKGKGPVVRQKEWQWRELSGREVWKEIQEGVLPAPEEKAALAARFRLLHETPGPERLPPNHHPALLFASAPSAIPLDATPATTVSIVPVPRVPGAFMLTDVLSIEECRSILAAAEAVGFHPDQPVGEEGASVLAHNLYWLADQDFLTTVCSRFLHLVPQELGGGKVTGINARFRVYRYVPGAIYRPHIDGAWPASGVDPVTGEYLYDSSPPDKPQWSRLTLLFYLNDDFTNGCTTYFLPSPTEGVLNAYPVKPIAGCALIFPHGDSMGSLLHEGSPVGEGGAKYIIRTEVLYECAKGSRGGGKGGEGEGEEP